MSQPNAAIEPLPEHHILVVDDDDRLRSLLSQYLSDQGFFVSEAENTTEAREILAMFAIDALVLDVMMPGETGVTFAQSLRAQGAQMPVLMLTALGETDDRIAGLEAGASDYLAKPFAPRELVLRLENLLKRQPKPATEKQLKFGEYTLDSATGRLSGMSGVVYLTGSEQECLKILAEHAPQPVARSRMAQLLGDVTNERSVDVQINRLRKKIEPNSAKPIYIQTIRHAGYALIAEPG
jgi:two-component system phosphate regulon response regulator OmpR